MLAEEDSMVAAEPGGLLVQSDRSKRRLHCRRLLMFDPCSLIPAPSTAAMDSSPARPGGECEQFDQTSECLKII